MQAGHAHHSKRQELGRSGRRTKPLADTPEKTAASVAADVARITLHYLTELKLTGVCLKWRHCALRRLRALSGTHGLKHLLHIRNLPLGGITARKNPLEVSRLGVLCPLRLLRHLRSPVSNLGEI